MAMTQYKFPRALVGNPAKLKQLQERVFLPGLTPV